MTSKAIISGNFSKHARVYDKYSTVQNFSALRLIEEANGSSFGNILEIGCGTGNYTKLLREKFPKARIKAIDISGEMIKIAKEKLGNEGIEFIIADAENLKLEKSFDLISSNASFQWFENLEADLARYKEALNKGGSVLFSTFGPRTFHELHGSLEEFSQKNLSLEAGGFLVTQEIERILKRSFGEVRVKEKIYKEKYSSLRELLEKVKCTGTRGGGLKGEIFWTPRTMVSIEKIYMKRFGSIAVTYQLFFCRGIK